MKEQSHANNTAFVHERVDIGGGEFLYVDGNSKITASNGTYEEPKPNAFSLVEILDCPFCTSICREECYVHGLAEAVPGLHSMFKHNSSTMRRLLLTGLDIVHVMRFSHWIAQNCVDFRWHVSGDVFSYTYAKFIASICKCSPDVRHWIYTRSLTYLEPLTEVPNLTVNLSADAENYAVASAAAKAYGLRICYLSMHGEVPDDLPEGSVIFPDYLLRVRGLEHDKHPHAPGWEWWDVMLTADQRKMVCPVDFLGKSEKRRCRPCDKCLVR